jgi:hypothetical protein
MDSPQPLGFPDLAELPTEFPAGTPLLAFSLPSRFSSAQLVSRKVTQS